MTKTGNDIERCIDHLSINTSLFPPGRQRQAEIAQEINVNPSVLREVIAQLSMGILAFVEPASEPLVTLKKK